MRDMRVPIWRLISTSLSRPRAVEFTKTQLSTRHPPLANVNRARWDQTMEKERRLVWRVRRYWTEITRGGRFPLQRNQSIYAWRGRSELSPDRGRVSNRAFAFCHGRSESRGHPLPTDTLAEVLLSRVPQVVSARRGLIIEGGAKWRSSIAPHCSHCLRTVARSTTCWVRRAIAL